MSWDEIDAELIEPGDVIRIEGDELEITVEEVDATGGMTDGYTYLVLIRGTNDGQLYRACFDRWETVLRKDA